MNTFSTTNRELENFFYVHDIRFVRFEKGADMRTIWYYDNTPYLREVLAEYQAVVSRRRANRPAR